MHLSLLQVRIVAVGSCDGEMSYQYTLYIDVSHLKFLCEMTTKNCANGPKLVLKALCEKSFVRNVRLPIFKVFVIKFNVTSFFIFFDL